MTLRYPDPVSNAPTRPLLSVIMPTYKRPQHIGKSIQAVLQQTCEDLELVICDDSPDEETQRLVSGLRDGRIRYTRNSGRLGMPENLNEGVNRSRGRYVVVAHDHDIPLPQRYERMLTILERWREVIFVHTGLAYVDHGGQPTGKTSVGNWPERTPGRDWLRVMLSQFSCPVAADVMVRRGTYEAYGLYDPAYPWYADVEMWLRLSLHGDVGYVPEALVLNRSRESDHELMGIRWDVADMIASMHRRYLPCAHSGVDLLVQRARFLARLDILMARLYAASIKRRDGVARREGRAYIRRHPIPLSRSLARLL